jgi:hypothetical protein
VQEVVFDHDSAGMLKVKLKLHDPHKSLVTLAKIKGMLRDETPPPPPQNLMLKMLANMPTPQLAALNAAMEEAEANPGVSRDVRTGGNAMICGPERGPAQ